MATISTHNRSSVSRGHNLRKPEIVEKESHIDPTKPHEIWIDESPRQAYHRLFGEALKRYNDKQTREDRQIKNYYNHVRDDAKKHCVYEMIIGVYSADGEDISELKGKDILKRFVDDWKDRNPNLELIGAYYHADEMGKAPHVHIDYIPVAHGYKRGLDTQNGMVKALGEQGFKGQGKVTAQILWEKRENEYLESLCNENGINVEHPQEGKGVKHLDTQVYKAKKDLECIEKRIDDRKKDLKDQQTKIRLNSIQISSTEKYLNELAEQGAERAEQLESVNKDLEQSKSTLQDVRKQSQTIRSKNIMASASLNKAREELSGLTDEVEDKKTELEEIRGDVDHLLTVKRELNEDIEQIKDEKEQLQRDVQELNHDIYNLEAKKDSIESEITETQSKLDKLKGMLGDFERILQTRVKGFVRGVFDSFQKVKEFVFEMSDGDPDILGTSAESIQFIEDEVEKSADAKFDEVIADPVKESISEEADKVENEIETEYPVYKSVRRR